jgi:hypothetical protein
MKQWKVDGYQLAGRTHYQILNENGEQICGLGDTDCPHEEATENARILAAAPDLLEACKLALDYFTEKFGGQQTVTGNALAAAIAKATK